MSVEKATPRFDELWAEVTRRCEAHDDMLAALRMAREYFNGAHIIAGDVDQTVRAAIAKAEGASP